jgi:alpha-tubulin suppressor-like RCC1 family protein
MPRTFAKLALSLSVVVLAAEQSTGAHAAPPLFADGHGARGAAWTAPAPTPTLGEIYGVEVLAAPRLDMPLQDNALFLAEDELHEEPGKRQRLAVGIPVALDLDDGEWVKVEGGRLWQIVIGSANATTARVHLAGLALGEGEEIRLSSPGFPEGTIGPIVGNGMFGTGDAWSSFMPTADVLVEWFVPEGRRVRTLPFTSLLYCHGYRDIFRLFEAADGGVAGNCHNAPACNPEWQNESNATTFLTFNSGGLSYICSGQLTATSAADETPYVSTAYHCISTAAEANSCQFRFFYRSSTCGASSSYGQTVTPGALVTAHAASDSTLLMLLGTLPSGVAWSGWTADNPGNGTGAVGIHHPSGAAQAISFGVKNGGAFNCAGAPSGNFHSVSWNNGITEGGSSGSAIYRQSDRRLFGVLTCGASSCTNPAGDDGYGRWDIAVNSGGFGALLAAGSDDTQEPNDTCFTAATSTLTASGSLSNLVVKRLDEDWYAMRVQPGQTLTVTSNFVPNYGSITLRLYETCGGTPLDAVVVGGFNSQTMTFVNTRLTDTLYLRVSLATNTRNSYSLTWNVATVAPANDNCTGAQTISIGSVPVVTTGATGFFTAPSTCLDAGGTTVGFDVWYRYVPPTSGMVTASTCGPSWGNAGGGLDTALAVYGNGATCTNPGVPIACNDNDPTCGGVVTAAGLGTNGQTAVPPTLGAVKAIAAGGAHSVALKADNLVTCWGSNASGQCTVPATVGAAKAIGAGSDHSAAVRTDGKVICWGSNQYNQRVPPTDLVDVKAIACGAYHNIALRSNGTVAGWGNNQFQQSTAPPALNGIVVTAVAAGGYHSVALKADGTVFSWGWSLLGQTPTPAGVANITQIAAGFGHTMALKANGDFIGWGANDQLQAQTGSFLRPMVSFAAGQFHTIGVSATGTVHCLGSNADGQCPGPTDPVVDLGVTGRVAAGFNHNLFLSCNDHPICETGSTVSWQATAGVTYYIRVGSPSAERGVTTLTLTSMAPPPCPADVNGSGAVDASDMAALLSAWGTNGAGTFDTDIDNDGIVGPSDLAIMLSAWGTCSP